MIFPDTPSIMFYALHWIHKGYMFISISIFSRCTQTCPKVAMKLTDIYFAVYQLDAYHYRIEVRNKSPPDSSAYITAVFYFPLGELHIQRDLSNRLLEAIIGFCENRFGKVRTIIQC
jgi:hypothetical protein